MELHHFTLVERRSVRQVLFVNLQLNVCNSQYFDEALRDRKLDVLDCPGGNEVIRSLPGPHKNFHASPGQHYGTYVVLLVHANDGLREVCWSKIVLSGSFRNDQERTGRLVWILSHPTSGGLRCSHSSRLTVAIQSANNVDAGAIV
uniref:(northern house mosquito) hypothetical protein n=1 Tax=Culex pipiens TaxID=7175 RepID=A0A8D8G7D7_CULPI